MLLKSLKSHFVTGLFVLIPLGVIGWILVTVLQTLWQLHDVLPENLRPEALPTNIAFTAALTLVLALAISVLGWASKHYLGQKILKFVGIIIERIPVIRSIYSALDQLLKTLAQGGGQQFNRVVYIEYPRKGVWALAFVTGPARPAGFSGGFLNVYIPTTPNPTSGFHLIVPETEVRESHLRVEDAFKTILSLGIAGQNG